MDGWVGEWVVGWWGRGWWLGGLMGVVGVWEGGCCGTWMHGGGWVAGKWLVGEWVDGLVGVWEDGCMEVNCFPLLYIQTPDQPPQRPLC